MVYGSSKKAWIPLHRGQIWKIVGVPDKSYFEWYSIQRNGIIIDVGTEDMKKYFRMEDRG